MSNLKIVSSCFSVVVAAVLFVGCSNLSNPIATENQALQSKTASVVTVPSGFNVYYNNNPKGIVVYKKDYTGGKPDYVAVVNLKTASIKSFTGTVSKDKIDRKLLSTFWTDASKLNTNDRKCRILINGTFFSTNENPTPIAFGLKVSNSLISYGYEIGSLVRLVSLNGSFGQISNYSKEALSSSAWPDVIGALDPSATNKSPSSFIPRTFAGIVDTDNDGKCETVLLFSSAYSNQSGANSVLKSFGATKTVMLDGGGSSGLIVNGTTAVSTTRLLPHCIAVFDGK